MAQEEQQRITTAGSGVALGSRIEIFPSQPLPELDTAGGQAYTARFKADASSNLYAIVCTSKITPRIESVQTMRNIDNPGILRFIEGGVVQWIDGTYLYAFVYQKPTSPPMFLSLDETHPLLSEDAIVRHFVAPMIGALTSLSNMGMIHNAIRPTNIFWRTGTSSPPQIGECLSVPAGVGQPVVFEPIERAMAMPLGRGVGTHADDCYAFGVTLAFLVMGRNPLQGIDDRGIIDLKMQKGSFGAIINNQRLPPTHIEILRGLLADDGAQRWTAADLDQWLNGRRMTPKSSDAGRRATRHFTFLGSDYWQIGPLVDAFAANPSEATKVIENEALNKWLRRALNDKDSAKDIEEIIEDLKQSGKTAHYEDQLVARVCIALDSSLPIRYRGISAMPMGIPTLLVDAMQTGNNVQALSEMIVSSLVSWWIQFQGETKADYVALGQLFDRLRGVLEKATFGNGIERAIYESNTAIPCLSPMLKSQYVTSPKLLLPALERIASTGNRSREPMDRHIAAFLIVRERRSEKSFLAMNGPEGSIPRGVALLALYAELQYKYGPENLPNLAAWLSPVVEPALGRVFNKKLRESLLKRAKDIIALGNLTLLLQLIDDSKRLGNDQKDFFTARILYLNIQKEIFKLEAKVNNREDVAKTMGKPIAVTLSSLLAVIIVCAAILRAMFGAFFR
ncbi:MAG: hypothetical protein WC521_03455 [Bdellovibrionales bacterium]